MDDSKVSFRELENQRRRSETRKKKCPESFLEALNHLLVADPLEIFLPGPPSLPVIFIIGAPRSGTTLLSQLLCAGLDVGFVDCIAARFWDAPVYGMKLSDAVSRGSGSFTFESDYACPGSPFEPHEFSYFWQKWLGDPYGGEEDFNWDGIDWTGLANEFGLMQRECQKPMCFKGLSAKGRLRHLETAIPQSVFVYIERDIVDNAASLLKARRHYYGSESEWWSLYPLGYSKIRDLEPTEQVVAQVHLLNQEFKAELDRLADSPVIRTTYSEICSSPGQLVHRVKETVSDFYDYTLAHVPGYPASFPFQNCKCAWKVQKQLQAASRELDIFTQNDPEISRVSVRAKPNSANTVATLVERGIWATGERVSALEQELSEMFGLHFACVSSGFAALQILLTCMEDDYSEIILPSFVCEAVLLAVQHTNLRTKIIDVCASTWNVSKEDMRAGLIVAPHTSGLPIEIEEPRNSFVIEDCAQSLGGKLFERHCGSLGDAAIFSFYATKIAGGGFGGAVASKDIAIVQRIRDMRQYNNRDEYHLRFQYPMSDLTAQIIIDRLGEIKGETNRRREIAIQYFESLHDLPL